MPVNDFLHNGQAQAGPFAGLTLGPVKPVKQVRQVLRIRSAAVILQGAVKEPVRLFHEDADVPVLGGMLTGVFDQVPEGFRQPLLIAADHCLPLHGQRLFGPQGTHLLPVLQDHLPDIMLFKAEFVTVRAEFLQPQQTADQRFHPFNLDNLLVAVGAGVHFAVQPQGRQRRLQLVRNIRRQGAGAPCLLAEAFLRHLNAVLHLRGSILHLRYGILPQGKRQIPADSHQIVLHVFGQPFQPPCLPYAAAYQSRQNQQEDSAEDVSDH